jgi:YaiO family outer membrane protein
LVQKRNLPIAFALRLLCLVHASALFFFRTGRDFPYAIVDYTQVLQTAGMMVIGLVPLLYGMTFYPLDFSRGRKLAITLLAMLHLIVFVPVQYLVHALILQHLSLLYMPLLFWAFGLTVDVFLVIAFYGWAASWEPLPYRHRSWWIPLRPILPAAAAILAAMLLLGFAAKANGQVPDWEHELRAGASHGEYDSDLGSLNGQFVRLTASRRFHDLFRADVGRAERLGESGFGLGAGWQRHLRQDTSFGLGASTGTGDVLFPRWRADVGIEHGVLPGDPLLLSLGYTHIQSKAENRSDGLGVSARWYGHAPWILSAHGRIERGHPGDTISRSAGCGAMLHFPGRYSLGAGIEFGETSYVLLTPDEAAVDFESFGWRAAASKELSADWGIGARLESFTSDVYDLWALGIELYRRW